eukprot:g19422.t1
MEHHKSRGIASSHAFPLLLDSRLSSSSRLQSFLGAGCVTSFADFELRVRGLDIKDAQFPDNNSLRDYVQNAPDVEVIVLARALIMSARLLSKVVKVAPDPLTRPSKRNNRRFDGMTTIASASVRSGSCSHYSLQTEI